MRFSLYRNGLFFLIFSFLSVSASAMACRFAVASSGNTDLANLHQHWQQNLYNPLGQSISSLQVYKQKNNFSVEEKEHIATVSQATQKYIRALQRGLLAMVEGVREESKAYQEKSYEKKDPELQARNRASMIDHAEQMIFLLNQMAEISLELRPESEKFQESIGALDLLKGELSSVYVQSHYRAVK